MIRLACGYELLSGGVWHEPFASKFFAVFSVCVCVCVCVCVYMHVSHPVMSDSLQLQGL